MYKKIEILRNIEYFSIQQSILIYKYQDEDTIYLDSKKLSNEYKYYGYLNKNFIQYGNESKHYLRDIERNEIFETPKVLLLQGFNGKSGFYTDNYIYDKAIRRSRSDLFKFDVSARTSSKILENSADILILANEEKLLLWLPRTTLKSLSLLTGEYEWEVDLGAYGEIRNILGIVEDELYVWLGSTTLVAISIQNGEVQWYINTYEIHKVGFVAGVHLLADERKVVLFYDTNYVEIDLQTQTSKLLLKNTFGKDWAFSANTVVGNCIYFTGRNYATGELSVGVFNRQKLEVEWYYAAPEWQGSVPDDYEGNAVVLAIPPQVTDDRLYVLENGTGTLYIFEKEQA